MSIEYVNSLHIKAPHDKHSRLATTCSILACTLLHMEPSTAVINQNDRHGRLPAQTACVMSYCQHKPMRQNTSIMESQSLALVISHAPGTRCLTDLDICTGNCPLGHDSLVSTYRALHPVTPIHQQYNTLHNPVICSTNAFGDHVGGDKSKRKGKIEVNLPCCSGNATLCGGPVVSLTACEFM